MTRSWTYQRLSNDIQIRYSGVSFEFQCEETRAGQGITSFGFAGSAKQLFLPCKLIPMLIVRQNPGPNDVEHNKFLFSYATDRELKDIMEDSSKIVIL